MNSTPVSSVRPVTGAKGHIVRGPAGETRTAAAAGSTHPSRVVAVDAAEPPLDAQRVDDIRRAIADGSYRIEPDKIADALLAGGASLRRQK
jgi:negative regulator of flagellin synthesis FlgM